MIPRTILFEEPCSSLWDDFPEFTAQSSDLTTGYEVTQGSQPACVEVPERWRDFKSYASCTKLCQELEKCGGFTM